MAKLRPYRYAVVLADRPDGADLRIGDIVIETNVYKIYRVLTASNRFQRQWYLCDENISFFEPSELEKVIYGF